MYRLYMAYNIKRRKKLQEKISDCNNNIIPLLKDNNIKWEDYDTRRIIIQGKVFPMKYIDNGKAEDFIESLIQGRQTSLDEWD